MHTLKIKNPVLIISITAIGLFLSSPAFAAKPNILVIVTDDQTLRSIEQISADPTSPTPHTPNLYKLFQDGAYLKNTYHILDQCSPSRASIWTSKTPHEHGLTVNGLGLAVMTHKPLSKYLQEGGYETAFIGKCHLGEDPLNPDPKLVNSGFDYRLVLYPDPQDLETGQNMVPGGLTNWYSYSYMENGQIFASEQPSPGVYLPNGKYITDLLTNRTIKWISGRGAAPWYLWLAYIAPHGPTIVPDGRDGGPASNYFTPSQFSPPVSATDNLSTKPP